MFFNDSDVLTTARMGAEGQNIGGTKRHDHRHFVLAMVAGLFMSRAVWAGALPSGLAELQPIPPLSEIQCPKTGAKPLTADSPPEIEGMPGGATLSYAQALGDLKAALEGSVSPKAIMALDSLPQAKDPFAATAAATAALAKEKPLATVAFLIKAHEAAPTEPVFLANLSGISNYVGLHREALAFAERAETLPKVKTLPAYQRAVLLSNKGYALIYLGRPKEAEAVLNEAIRLNPNLPEAYSNLAYSLGDQDRCESAAHFRRAGMTRHPAEVYRSKGKDQEQEQVRIPLSQVISLAKGIVGMLPPVPIASNPDDVEVVRKQLEVLDKYADELAKGGDEKGAEAMQGILARRMRWANEGVSGTLTANFAEALLSTFNIYTIEIVAFHQTWLGGTEQPAHQDPELRPLAESAVRANYKMIQTIRDEDAIWGPRSEVIQGEYDRKMEHCRKLRDPNSCEALAALKRDSAMCVLGKELGARREQRARDYDHALRDLYAESYRRASALAAYFSDPSHQKWTRLMLQGYAASTLQRLVGNSNAASEMYARVAGVCKAADKTPQDILFERLKQMMNECKEAGKVKASFSVLEVSTSCEEVEIGASTPGEVGLFGKVGYKFSQRFRRITDPKERFMEQQAGRDPDVALNLPGYGGAFDGQLTVTGGVQAKTTGFEGVAEAGAQASAHVTFDGHANIVDSGGEFKVSGSVQGGDGLGKAETSLSAKTGSKGTEFSGSASASSGAGGAGAGVESEMPLFAPSVGDGD